MLSVLRNASGMNNTNLKKKILSTTDAYLSAEELIEFGLADRLLDKRA